MNVRPLIMVLTGGITALLSATASFGAPLEEIVTYAERRSSDVQDVPVAVSTFTSDEIDRRQITGTIDLIQNVPNMSGSHNVSLGGSNSYFLRGIGNAESIATFDVPIGTYIDEIYISAIGERNAEQQSHCCCENYYLFSLHFPPPSIFRFMIERVNRAQKSLKRA